MKDFETFWDHIPEASKQLLKECMTLQLTKAIAGEAYYQGRLDKHAELRPPSNMPPIPKAVDMQAAFVAAANKLSPPPEQTALGELLPLTEGDGA